MDQRSRLQMLNKGRWPVAISSIQAAALIVGLGFFVLVVRVVGECREVFVFDGEPPHWLVVEYENPRCSKVVRTTWGRILLLGGDGYACYADSRNDGMIVTDIRSPATGHLVASELVSYRRHIDYTVGDCLIGVDAVFFGKRSELHDQGPDAIVRAHHPECPW